MTDRNLAARENINFHPQSLPHKKLQLIICWLALPFLSVLQIATAAPLIVGLGQDPIEGSFLANEWMWALRGGGADFSLLNDHRLGTELNGLSLLILDSVPLSQDSSRAIKNYVQNGGLLIYAGAPAALEELANNGTIISRKNIVAEELLGLQFRGFDPGLTKSYPAIQTPSRLLSPLMPGDALRLGKTGIGNSILLKVTDGEILALGTRWSPGPSGMELKTGNPTITTRKFGKGRVIFLSFSPGQIGACLPAYRQNHKPTDCSGAGSAHALMRWITVNLLWEEKQLQFPLLWEAPGNKPLAFIVTGDVHGQSEGVEAKAATQFASVMNKLKLPLSYYIEGNISKLSPDELNLLKGFPNLEIGTHSLNGKVYTTKDFGFHGFGTARGILKDIRATETALDIPHFPEHRKWLLSTRSHGWLSDQHAWTAMQDAGIGLAFDQVDNPVNQKAPWRVPTVWFNQMEKRSIFVPLFEKSLSTSAGDFLLTPQQYQNIAILASGQPEPYEKPVEFSLYLEYVNRWHNIFKRLATLGGISEVWLWHPGGLSGTDYESKPQFSELEAFLSKIRKDNSVEFIRGDVLATWRANRERYTIHPIRNESGKMEELQLQQNATSTFPLPPGSSGMADSIGYWIIGPNHLKSPEWSATTFEDPYGRIVTLLKQSLHPTP